MAGFLAQAGLGRQVWPFVATHSALELPARLVHLAVVAHLGRTHVGGGGQFGAGEALRLHNLTAVYDSEQWASKVVDWLEARRIRNA